MVKFDVDVNNVPLPNGCSIYLDGFEEDNFRYLNKRARSNFDSLGIVVGEEGAGKTTWALQRAFFMDHNFGIDNVVFNEKEFFHATETLPKGSAIVWDESDAASGHWANTIVRAIKTRFKRCRKNNYTIFLVTPTFFDFDKYFVNHRAIFLVDVYADYDVVNNSIKRGFFRSFNRPTMRNLYFKGKVFWNMKAEKPNFIGRFSDYPKNFPIDMSDGGEYDVKKDNAMKQSEEENIDPKIAVVNYRREVIKCTKAVLASRDIKLSQRDLAKCLNVSNSTIIGDVKAISKESEGVSVNG